MSANSLPENSDNDERGVTLVVFQHQGYLTRLRAGSIMFGVCARQLENM